MQYERFPTNGRLQAKAKASSASFARLRPLPAALRVRAVIQQPYGAEESSPGSSAARGASGGAAGGHRPDPPAHRPSGFRWSRRQRASRGRDDMIELNVGGRLMQTTRSTLRALPGSRLAAMFRAGPEAGAEGEAGLPRDACGRVQLDVDPGLFGLVLSYLRRLKNKGGRRPQKLPALTAAEEGPFHELLGQLGLLPHPVVDIPLPPPQQQQPAGQPAAGRIEAQPAAAPIVSPKGRGKQQQPSASAEAAAEAADQAPPLAMHGEARHAQGREVADAVQGIAADLSQPAQHNVEKKEQAPGREAPPARAPHQQQKQQQREARVPRALFASGDNVHSAHSSKGRGGDPHTHRAVAVRAPHDRPGGDEADNRTHRHQHQDQQRSARAQPRGGQASGEGRRPPHSRGPSQDGPSPPPPMYTSRRRPEFPTLAPPPIRDAGAATASSSSLAAAGGTAGAAAAVGTVGIGGGGGGGPAVSQLFYISAEYCESRGLRVSVHTEDDIRGGARTAAAANAAPAPGGAAATGSGSETQEGGGAGDANGTPAAAAAPAAPPFDMVVDATYGEGQMSLTVVARRDATPGGVLLGLTSRGYLDRKGAHIPCYGWKSNGRTYNGQTGGARFSAGSSGSSLGGGDGSDARRGAAPHQPSPFDIASDALAVPGATEPLWRKGDCVELILRQGQAAHQLLIKVNGTAIDVINGLPALRNWCWYVGLWAGGDVSCAVFQREQYAVYWADYAVKRYL